MANSSGRVLKVIKFLQSMDLQFEKQFFQQEAPPPSTAQEILDKLHDKFGDLSLRISQSFG
jgi:hypothetical protein